MASDTKLEMLNFKQPFRVLIPNYGEGNLRGAKFEKKYSQYGTQTDPRSPTFNLSRGNTRYKYLGPRSSQEKNEGRQRQSSNGEDFEINPL